MSFNRATHQVRACEPAGPDPACEGFSDRFSTCSFETATERHREAERPLLVSVATPELHSGLPCRLLDAATGTLELFARIGRDRHISRESERRMAVRELQLAIGERLLLASAARGVEEAALSPELGVGDIRGAGLLSATCGLEGTQGLHRHGDRLADVASEKKRAEKIRAYIGTRPFRDPVGRMPRAVDSHRVPEHLTRHRPRPGRAALFGP